EIGLVVTGRGDDHLAPIQGRLLEHRQLAGVGQQPFRLGDARGLDGAGILVDEQNIVAVGQQLGGDGTPDVAGSGDGDAHQCSTSGVAARTRSTVSTSSARISRCTRSPSCTTVSAPGSTPSP